jgi:hypothetical protein
MELKDIKLEDMTIVLTGQQIKCGRVLGKLSDLIDLVWFNKFMLSCAWWVTHHGILRVTLECDEIPLQDKNLDILFCIDLIKGNGMWMTEFKSVRYEIPEYPTLATQAYHQQNVWAVKYGIFYHIYVKILQARAFNWRAAANTMQLIEVFWNQLFDVKYKNIIYHYPREWHERFIECAGVDDSLKIHCLDDVFYKQTKLKDRVINFEDPFKDDPDESFKWMVPPNNN